MRRISYILLILATVLAGCRKPYNPPVITAKTTYLVVEGVINTGSDSTIINLSRTVPLSSTVTKSPQTGAIVTVENDQNGSFPLTEITPGKYVSPGLNLDNTRKYRLRIKTTNNNQYLSDFVPVKITPPIDSIGFTVAGNNLQIYANAHDPNNATRYYRWDYTETWEFHSEFDSGFITNGTAIVPRTNAQGIYYCYTSDASSTIDIGSSAALTQDVIYQAPITLIPSTSEKIEMKYSILLHQYALTSDAYNFWQNLKKNTEELGSIFDAQPSNSAGNIHNINNPDEIVVGYISASTIQTKRIFISNSQLPRTWVPTYPYVCKLDSAWFHDPITKQNEVAIDLIPLHSASIPVSDYFLPGNNGAMPDGYLASSISCVDCTIRGTTQIPSFWQ